MVENKSKKSEKDGGSNKDASEKEKDKGSKSGDSFNTSFSDFKEDKVLPFFDAGEEEFLKSHGLKEHSLDEDGDSKPSLTSRDIFGKWSDEPKYSTSYPSFKEKGRREADEDDSVEEEMYRSRKHSSKKEEKSKKKEKKDKEKSRRSPSPPAPSREKERPLFPAAAAAAAAAHQGSPVHHLSSTREEFELKISSLEDMPRYSPPPRAGRPSPTRA